MSYKHPMAVRDGDDFREGVPLRTIGRGDGMRKLRRTALFMVAGVAASVASLHQADPVRKAFQTHYAESIGGASALTRKVWDEALGAEAAEIIEIERRTGVEIRLADGGGDHRAIRNGDACIVLVRPTLGAVADDDGRCLAGSYEIETDTGFVCRDEVFNGLYSGAHALFRVNHEIAHCAHEEVDARPGTPATTEGLGFVEKQDLRGIQAPWWDRLNQRVRADQLHLETFGDVYAAMRSLQRGEAHVVEDVTALRWAFAESRGDSIHLTAHALEALSRQYREGALQSAAREQFGKDFDSLSGYETLELTAHLAEGALRHSALDSRYVVEGFGNQASGDHGWQPTAEDRAAIGRAHRHLEARGVDLNHLGAATVIDHLEEISP